ncbi:Caspase recruitment domain-containing protein 9, partial [Ataeniobius toweri]|nr:Caspase recruitment domain-containing protein 9 [Ataeniobius toweri]
MEGVSEDDLCWLQLDDFRMLLIKTIDPSRITPYLRQCQVISAEDEEQLFNDPTLVIRRRKVGMFSQSEMKIRSWILMQNFSKLFKQNLIRPEKTK